MARIDGLYPRAWPVARYVWDRLAFDKKGLARVWNRLAFDLSNNDNSNDDLFFVYFAGLQRNFLYVLYKQQLRRLLAAVYAWRTADSRVHRHGPYFSLSQAASCRCV